MSANAYDYPIYYGQTGELVAPQLAYAPRKRYQALLFLPGAMIAGISWMGGGIAALTDLSFVLLTLACLTLLIEELVSFPRRFGLGGITLYGGVLVWFCHDYFTHWFLLDFVTSVEPYGPGVLAKSAFLHQLFVMTAAVGLQLPIWKPLERMLASIPDPRSDQLYLPIILVAFLVGMIPYIFFAADPLPIALYKEIVSGRAGEGVFVVGRSGSVNYDWGAYLSQLQQIGQVGAILALFYVMLLKPGIFTTILCVGIWLLQLALAFGSGTRGHTAYMAMPALFVLFLKHQSQAAEMLRRFSLKAYVISGIAAFILLVLLQIQITYRDIGYTALQMEEVRTGIEGNSMFSEGLAGMALVPEQRGFFQNAFPGHGMVLAMPDLAWRFIYGPIPRALWTSKPIDPMWKWYNSVVTGRPEEQVEGTTIAPGLVGDFYFRHGLAGLIEGALLFGWLCAVGERVLQNSQGRLIQLVTATGILVFLFRSFRGFTFITLYPLMIGVVFLVILIKLTGARQQDA